MVLSLFLDLFNNILIYYDFFELIYYINYLNNNVFLAINVFKCFYPTYKNKKFYNFFKKYIDLLIFFKLNYYIN